MYMLPAPDELSGLAAILVLSRIDSGEVSPDKKLVLQKIWVQV